MVEMQNCLPRLPRRGKCGKVSFLTTQRNGANRFLNQDHVDDNHGALTTLPPCWLRLPTTLSAMGHTGIV